MKKISTISMLLAVCLIGLSSCLKPREYTPSPVGPGVSIYYSVLSQNIIADDPASIAFRLNILLSTSASKETTFDKVKVSVNNEDYSLKQLLFGWNEITENTPGVFTITFTYDSKGIDDLRRIGIINIDTKGKLLEDLIEDSWVVTPKDDKYEIASNESLLVIKFSEPYNISCGSVPCSWSISSYGLKCSEKGSSSTQEGEWSFSRYVSTTVSSLTYDEIKKAKFYVNGSSNGTLIGWPFEFNYEIESPLTYYVGCGRQIINDGIEFVDVPELPAKLPHDYPYGSVRLKRTGSDCSSGHIFNYGLHFIDNLGNVADPF